jgi:asparagine synthetase B (glutamine-hydrolysing)
MCSFLISSIDFSKLDLATINRLLKLRGPDLTNINCVNNIFFLHNLLNITGDIIPQPFSSSDKSIIAIYNGEFYNYRSFENELNTTFKSDGECLIPLYQKYGEEIFHMLDGEYALIIFDFNTEKIYMSTDTFSTKPLYYAIENGQFGISSYPTPLRLMGFNRPEKMTANMVLTFSITTLEPINLKQVYTFNLDQHKDNYDDWCTAFEKAVIKRYSEKYPVYICLSSGYDSGAIACALNRHNKKFYSYTIVDCEKMDTLHKRLYLIKDNCEPKLLSFDKYTYDRHYNRLVKDSENFKMKFITNDNSLCYYDVHGDVASTGLNYICDLSKKEHGCRVYLSGSGCDEIMSDYSINGQSISKTSYFNGIFPENLEGFFPKYSFDTEATWKNFYSQTQETYLMKEEMVAGANGIEGRYPFLDRECVQEFIWLKSELKNKFYKSAVHYYMTKYNFPFDINLKLGFNARKNLE